MVNHKDMQGLIKYSSALKSSFHYIFPKWSTERKESLHVKWGRNTNVLLSPGMGSVSWWGTQPECPTSGPFERRSRLCCPSLWAWSAACPATPASRCLLRHPKMYKLDCKSQKHSIRCGNHGSSQISCRVAGSWRYSLPAVALHGFQFLHPLAV